jgi:hypothetical protein
MKMKVLPIIVPGQTSRTICQSCNLEMEFTDDPETASLARAMVSDKQAVGIMSTDDILGVIKMRKDDREDREDEKGEYIIPVEFDGYKIHARNTLGPGTKGRYSDYDITPDPTTPVNMRADASWLESCYKGTAGQNSVYRAAWAAVFVILEHSIAISPSYENLMSRSRMYYDNPYFAIRPTAPDAPGGPPPSMAFWSAVDSTMAPISQILQDCHE